VNRSAHCVPPFSHSEAIPVMVETARTSNYSAHDGSGLWVGVGNVSDAPSKPTLIDPALNPTTPVRFSRLQGYAPRGYVRRSLPIVVAYLSTCGYLELCFWLFLVNTRSAQQNWFRSKFFYVWVAGSVCAITYMPAVTALGRGDPLKVSILSRCFEVSLC
jgi:hypothetical protein